MHQLYEFNNLQFMCTYRPNAPIHNFFRAIGQSAVELQRHFSFKIWAPFAILDFKISRFQSCATSANPQWTLVSNFSKTLLPAAELFQGNPYETMLLGDEWVEQHQIWPSAIARPQAQPGFSLVEECALFSSKVDDLFQSLSSI